MMIAIVFTVLTLVYLVVRIYTAGKRPRNRP